MAERKSLPAAAAEHRTANARLHGSYGRYFRWFTGLAILVHTVLLFLVVTPRGERFHARGEEMQVVDIPPQITVPPPEEIAPPATPVMRETPVADDITIAETEIEADAPVLAVPALPLPEPPPVEEANPSLTTYTVKPRCKVNCTADHVRRHIPPLLLKSGVSCDLAVALRIDTRGKVTATEVLKPSDNPECDEAAQAWARTTEWTSAYNRDQPVVVWITQPVTIRTE